MEHDSGSREPRQWLENLAQVTILAQFSLFWHIDMLLLFSVLNSSFFIYFNSDIQHKKWAFEGWGGVGGGVGLGVCGLEGLLQWI